MVAVPRPTPLLRLKLLQLLLACLLLAATVDARQPGRQLQQAKKQYLNLAWTVRGKCSASFLKNGTYSFEKSMNTAILADLKRASPSSGVVFLDKATIAGGGTSCKNLVVDWTTDPFAGYYFSYQFTATAAQLRKLLADARNGKGYGSADGSTYRSSLAVPRDQLPRQPGRSR